VSIAGANPTKLLKSHGRIVKNSAQNADFTPKKQATSCAVRVPKFLPNIYLIKACYLDTVKV
jgi:hypothetical protein